MGGYLKSKYQAIRLQQMYKFRALKTRTTLDVEVPAWSDAYRLLGCVCQNRYSLFYWQANPVWRLSGFHERSATAHFPMMRAFVVVVISLLDAVLVFRPRPSIEMRMPASVSVLIHADAVD